MSTKTQKKSKSRPAPARDEDGKFTSSNAPNGNAHGHATLAAYEGDPSVTPRTVRRTTRMSLDHRLKRLPFEEDEKNAMNVFHDMRTELDLED